MIPALVREFGLALALLTRVPAGWLAGAAPLPAFRAVWAFPLIGAGIGAAGGVVLLAGSAAGMPHSLAAAWALAAAALLSGALHEDGLADLADGFGGGRSVERKLAIMRDSRLGSYGALALVLAVAIRLLAAAAVADRPGAVAALAASGALSRGSMAMPLLMLRPARPGGLGAAVDGAGWRRGTSLILAAAVAGAALPIEQAAAAIAAAGMAAGAVCALARAQIGGFTGDVLGGCAVAAECAALSALAAA